jgi:hypothetical protein
VHACRCATPVHQRCVAKWILHSYQRGRGSPHQCEVCQNTWTGTLARE